MAADCPFPGLITLSSSSFLLYPRSLPRPRSTGEIQRTKHSLFLVPFGLRLVEEALRRFPQFDDVALQKREGLAGYCFFFSFPPEPTPGQPTLGHLISVCRAPTAFTVGMDYILRGKQKKKKKNAKEVRALPPFSVLSFLSGGYKYPLH